MHQTSNRTLAQFSLCKNNKEYKLQEIVKHYENLKSITDIRSKVQQSNRDLLDIASRKTLQKNGLNQ